ncbi:MAG TPA: helix-turn-helix domain-containing protein [Methanocorpusculum sp.]|nr:helix-turn-helix domain-containing protein [Methanocorpusculum sp.]
MSEENVSVIEQGSSEAQKIAKAMSSPTASDLYNKLADAPATASALAQTTGLPLTTVKYHLENLLEAGVIEVVKTRFSEKGREMKIYGVADKVVIFAPPQSKSAGAILKKYGVIAGGIAIASAFTALIPRVLYERTQTAVPVPSPAANGPHMMLAVNDAVSGTGGVMETFAAEAPVYSVKMAADTAAGGAANPIGEAALDVIGAGALTIFICGMVILLGFMTFELVKNRRTRAKYAYSEN